MDMETDEQQKARMELYNALLEGLSDIKAGRVIPVYLSLVQVRQLMLLIFGQCMRELILT